MVGLFVLSMTVSIVVGQLLDYWLEVICDEDEQDHNDDDRPYNDRAGLFVSLRLARIGVSVFYYLFIIIVAIRTRALVRQKYKIRPQYCGECEDFCCVVCCYACTVCQIARHTVDYEQHEATCCTATGLPKDDDYSV